MSARHLIAAGRFATGWRPGRGRWFAVPRIGLLGVLAAVLLLPANGRTAGGTADEVHYTFTSATSVAFDWRGTATEISYGPTTGYGTTVTAHTPSPLPISSPGPFQEVDLAGLTPGASYHYSIGGGPDHTFRTVPTGSFRFDAIADVSSSLATSKMAPTMAAVAADNPAFVLVNGDLTYANQYTQSAADQHFNDVMAWSQTAAYMPAWGNHEWENPADDDLRNYKGRFALPHPQTAFGAPAPGCCGEDWDWFDAGGVRFISYPDTYKSGTWSDWQTQAEPILAAAQTDPSINYIVTYGHRPAYSTGAHPGETTLATILDSFGARYPKYVLDLNGHSHNYERFQPINGVTHITTGAATGLDPNWTGTDARTAVRMLHTEHLRIDVSSTSIHIDVVCGPASSLDDTTCAEGSIADSYTIGVPPPPPSNQPVLYVDRGNASCSDSGPGTAAQPYCTIRAAALVVTSGETVQVASGTYPEAVTVTSSGTATAPIAFTTAPGAAVTLTGQANGFSISNKSWVTVNGFTVTSTSGEGIVVSNSSNITISNNHVTLSGQPVSGQTKSGIALDGVTSSLVSGNTVDHTSSYGIALNNSSGNQIRGNTSFLNAQGYQRAASGIRAFASTGNTISSNIAHDNEDSGIEFDGGANDNLVVDNLTYKNGDHGIDDLASTGIRIIGNTVYSNVTAGINVEGNSTGATIANNISVDNGIASPRSSSNIRVETGSTAGTTLDYDIVSISTTDPMIRFDSITYASLAAFQAATGQESHGLQADPKWRDTAAGDFHLTVGSPAIDSANSGASGQSTVDLEGTSRIDDPATADTGVGARTYDDRGAFEWNAAPLDHIVINPASATIFAGGSQTFTVQGFDQSNNLMGDMTPSATFSISPNGSCIANSCSATATGAHTVTATAGGKTATASLTVNSGLDHLVISPAAATINAGGSQAYTAQGFDAANNSLGDVTAATSFTITPNGSCSGASCTASSGGPHTVTASNSGKTATASLTVDYIKNFGFETDTSGWNTSGSGANITLSRVAGGHSGGFAAQIKNTGTTTSTYAVLQDSPNWVTTTIAGKYTATLWIKADTAGAIFKLKFQEYNGNTLVGTANTQVTLTTSWQKVTVSYTAANPGTTLDLQTYTINPTAGSAFYIDDTSILYGVTVGALDHIVISPATATIDAGGSQAYTAQGFDAANNSLGDVTAATTFTIAPNGSCTGATCTATATGAAHRHRHRQRQDRHGQPHRQRRRPRPHRHHTRDGHHHGGRLAGLHGAGLRRRQQLTRRRHGQHDVQRLARRLLHGRHLHRNRHRRAHRHRHRRHQDGNGLADRQCRRSRPHRHQPRHRHDHRGRLAGLHGAGLRRRQQLARRHDGEHDLHDRTQRQLHRRHLHRSRHRRAHRHRHQRRQDGDGVADRHGGGTRPHRHLARDGHDHVGRLAGVYGAGLRRRRQLARRRHREHDLHDRTQRQLHRRHLHRNRHRRAHRHRHRRRQDRDGVADGDGGDARPHRHLTGNGHHHGRRLAGLYSAGLRRCRQLARRRDGEHDLLDRTQRQLHRRQLHRNRHRRAHRHRHQRRQDRHRQPHRQRACNRPHRHQPGHGHDHLGRLAGVHRAGLRRCQQLARRHDGEHDLHDQPQRQLHRRHLHRNRDGRPHRHRNGRRQDRDGLADGQRRLPRPHRHLTRDGHHHGRRLAGVYRAGLRRRRQLTRQRHRRHDLHDQPQRQLHRCHLHRNGHRRAHRHRHQRRQDRHRQPHRQRRHPRPHRHQPRDGHHQRRRLAGLHRAGLRRSQQLTRQRHRRHHLHDRPERQLHRRHLHRNRDGRAHRHRHGRRKDRNSVADGDGGDARPHRHQPRQCHHCGRRLAGLHSPGLRRRQQLTRRHDGEHDLLDLAQRQLHRRRLHRNRHRRAHRHRHQRRQDRHRQPHRRCRHPRPHRHQPGHGHDHLRRLAGLHGAGLRRRRQLTRQRHRRHDLHDQHPTAAAPAPPAPQPPPARTPSPAPTPARPPPPASPSTLEGAAPSTTSSSAPAAATINAGGSQAYTAQGFDAANNSLGDVTAATSFTITPNGSCSGASCTASSGGPHTVTASNSGKTATASLTVDYIKNFGFETDTSGWNTSGSGANITLSRVAGGHSGGFAAQIKNTGTTTSTYAVLQDSPNWVTTTIAGKYTATLWIKADTAGAIFKLKFQEYNGNTLVGTANTQVTLTTSWQKVTVSYTAANPGTTLDLQTYTINPTAGSAFYIDDTSILYG